MGSALQAQNTEEDNSHFVDPTFGSIVKTITSCVLEKMVPLARQCSEIIRKRGNQDVRYQEFNEMTLDCRRGEREKIAAVKGHFVF